MYRLEPRETYDQFIIGVGTWKSNFAQSIVYDQDAIIEHLAQTFRESDPELDEDQALTDAQEHFEFNIVGSSGFCGAPVYVSKLEYVLVCEEEEHEEEQRALQCEEKHEEQ